MADNKVHPAGESSSSPEHPTTTTTAKRSATQSSEGLLASSSSSPSVPPHPPVQKPLPPPPGTYVIQIPKEQIFSYPPPENTKNFQFLSRRKPRRSCWRRCVCYSISLIIILILAAAITAGVLYLVFQPKAPKYTVLDVAIQGLNLTSSAISPEFDVSIRAENPNKKIGIYYQSGSKVEVSHGVSLSNGALPVFYQPPDNLTVFQTALKGSNVVLANDDRLAFGNEQRKGNVPFRLNIKAPVKIKVGSVKTWRITVKIYCDVAVDALNEKSKIVSKSCDYSVKLW